MLWKPKVCIAKELVITASNNRISPKPISSGPKMNSNRLRYSQKPLGGSTTNSQTLKNNGNSNSPNHSSTLQRGCKWHISNVKKLDTYKNIAQTLKLHRILCRVSIASDLYLKYIRFKSKRKQENCDTIGENQLEESLSNKYPRTGRHRVINNILKINNVSNDFRKSYNIKRFCMGSEELYSEKKCRLFKNSSRI